MTEAEVDIASEDVLTNVIKQIKPDQWTMKLPDELVQGMWDIISREVEDWHKIGVFPPAVEVPEDADLQTKLLGMCGREA